MAGRPTVFLDMHGTLGDVHGNPEDGYFPDFEWFPDAPEAVRLLNEAGFLAIAVTNQASIAQGRFTLDDFRLRMTVLQQELSGFGARLDAWYCCPHVPEDACRCRKPRTGMVEDACLQFDIDLARSYVVGDRGDTDMLLAANVGARGILVTTGQGQGSVGDFRHLWSEFEADHVASDVLDAARWIVGR